MRIQVDYPDASRSVALSIERNDATVADFAREVGLDSTAPISIDGSVHFADALLSDVGLVDGSRVAPLDGAHAGRSSLGSTWLGVANGPGVGSVRTLDAVGSVLIGRDPNSALPISNSSVSMTHAVVQRVGDEKITVEDLDSLNGTWVGDRSITKETTLDLDGDIRIGSSTLSLRTVSQADRPIGVSAQHANDRGRVLFNRPPRSVITGPAEMVELPDEPVERIAPTLAIASLIAPLVFAGVMVYFLGSFRYALFGLLSPVMAIGTWLSGRRRTKKAAQGDVRTHREALARLRTDLDRAAETERRRRSSFAPDLLEIRRRIELPSTTLWERRLSDEDAMCVRVGLGQIQFNPSEGGTPETVAPDVQQIVDEHGELTDIELVAYLGDGPVGITGGAEERASLARSMILQLATHHGPADISVAVLTTEERLDEWSWTHWLPHARTEQEGSRIMIGDEAAAFVADIKTSLDPKEQYGKRVLQPGWLLIVDDLELLHRRSSPVRDLLERSDTNIFGIVLTDTSDQLPASTRSITTITNADGEATLQFTERPDVTEHGIVDLVPVDVADDVARSMARFEDPDLPMPNGDLPRIVRGVDMYGPNLTPEKLQRRWMLSTRTDKLEAAIGIGEQGIVSIDMVGDGPHALIGGTTGAGKSELLRSFVLGLAVNYDPDDLVFVLVDYKGGSAFDACGDLPHIVGFVTDLDNHLAERALQSLEAELHHRESVLRSAAAKDITDYRAADSPGGALPRLVVVIDEFATLRSELPDFVASLIGIAQRGRSLGVHLVLATQRPTGAVDANIKANTNMRIALRMQDGPDSRDVIDDDAAAKLSRSTPGRAYIRTGQGELTVVQTGFVSGSTATDATPLRVAEIPIGTQAGPRFPSQETSGDSTELEQIVASILATPRRGGEPRRPWLPELPEVVKSHMLIGVPSDDAADLAIPVVLGDEPAHQRRLIRQWNPREGGLVVVGTLGSGVSTSLNGVIARLGTIDTTRSVWVFPVDHGAGGLTGIDRYPHVSPIIPGSDLERQARLFSILADTLNARRELGRDVVDTLPLMVVVVDGAASFKDAHDLSGGSAAGELWERIVRDGPAVGIVTVLGASRRTEIPRSSWASAVERLFLEQSDPSDFSEIGIRAKNVPSFMPGRGFWADGAMLGQVIPWHDMIEPDDCRVPEPIPDVAPLESAIDRAVLASAVPSVEPDLVVPIGIDEATRRIAQLVVRAGEHGSICGPGKSGRTSALILIAEQLRAQFADLVMVGLAPTPVADLFACGAFDAHGTIEGLDHVLNVAQTDERRWVIIVDDGERIDADGPLLDLAKNAPPTVTIIAAMRSSTARQSYGHWTRFVRGSGTGIILGPDNSVDGELLGVRLPRHDKLPDLPGRGYLVSGSDAHAVQLAL